MARIKLRKDRVLLKKVVKKTLLTTSTENRNQDYEKFIFEVVDVSDNVEDREYLIGKKILKQENLGLNIEYNSKEYIVITQDNILAILE